MFPKVEEMAVPRTVSLETVLRTIDRNGHGVLFVVDENRKFLGILTDGDIRRSILKGYHLQSRAEEIMNTDCITADYSSSEEELMKILNEKDGVKYIPLIDAEDRLVDYACLHRRHRISVLEPYLNGNELDYVTDCVRSKWISSQGKYVLRFEEMFSDLIGGGGTAVAVSNGTTALHLALLTLGIGSGDEVIVPDLTFAASINSIIHAGATPVLVDILPDTWCMDPVAVEKAITPKTKAIMLVHLYGFPCDVDALQFIARKYNLAIIEDAAEALGARYKGVPVGLFGDVGTFSFFGNKAITTGEGGMVLYKDPTLAARARLLRDHGMSREKKYWHTEVGYNYRMTNLQAALGVAQLEQFELIQKFKTQLAQRYRDALSLCEGVTLPPSAPWANHSYWLFSILIEPKLFGDRNSLIEKLLSNGIETRPLFYPLHEMPPYKQFKRDQSFEVSSFVSARGLSLPSSASLSVDEQDWICQTLVQIMSVKQMVLDQRQSWVNI